MALFRFLFATSPLLMVASLATTAFGALATTGMLMTLVTALHFNDGPGHLAGVRPWVGMAIASGLVILARTISRNLLSRVFLKAIFHLRVNVAQQILDAPLIRLEQIGSTKLLAVFTHDIPVVAAASSELLIMTANLTVVLGSLAYVAWLWSTGTLFLIVTVALSSLVYVNLHRLATVHSRRGYRHWDRLIEKFNGLVFGVKELQINSQRREAFIGMELRPCAEELRQANEKTYMLFALASSWAQGVFLLLLIGIVAFENGANDAVTTGFSIAVLYAMAPLQALLATVRAVTEAGQALQRMDSLGVVGTVPRHDEIERRVGLGVQQFRSIALSDVFYRYPSRRDGNAAVLGPINFTVRSGEIVFVTGKNGAGKTTLAKLLAGLYEPESGSIHINGQLIESGTLKHRDLFAAVFNDLFVFSGISIQKNDESAELRVRALLCRFGIDDIVGIENGNFTTTKELSTAQRKRLALVVAWLEDRPILLLDEWAAEQDVGFRDVFYREILGELKRAGKTVIVISHDPNFDDVADRLVVVESGRVTEKPEASFGNPVGRLAEVGADK
ncbi:MULTISPECIES: cyclic peptide export ABC transporter [unclassified Bradyrhizobium]|uniref:cyclic peptide export ABC transporter n=1 Tax=unclassified Bradyrhizobium TaxID=2631580 RepID=UPI0028EDD48D|nr:MULTISPECIES: cyclic peptide export ABC transporter [unclassified Bradyrhizobium]